MRGFIFVTVACLGLAGPLSAQSSSSTARQPQSEATLLALGRPIEREISSGEKHLYNFNYYAVPGNLTSLGVFRDRGLVLWWRALRRRSQKHRISWTRTLALAQRWLPPPQVLHPFPDARFAATYLR
jgi:hypothetical protein